MLGYRSHNHSEPFEPSLVTTPYIPPELKIMKNTQKFVIIFAKDEQGNEIKHRFMLCTSKSVLEGNGTIAKAIQAFEGIDRIEPVGRYTIDVVIGRAFDADEVLLELKKTLDGLLSNIITPKLVV